MTEMTVGRLLSAGDLPAPGGWRSALYRPDAPGAVLDGQPWAASWPAYMRAITDVNDSSARQYIGRVMNAAGMSERLPGGGGFLVPEALRSEVVAYLTEAIVRPQAMVLPMAAERLSVPVLDNPTETSGNQALGGLVFAMTEEGAGIASSAPSFARVTLEARKITAMMSGVSNDFVADAAGAFGDFMSRVIALGNSWAEDDLFIQGTGVGEPQGLISAPCAVSVTRTNAAAAPVQADFVTMLKALHPQSKRAGLTPGVTSVAWLLSATVLDAILDAYYVPGGGAATAGTPISTPGWFSMGDGYLVAPSVLGLPCIISDHQPAAGTRGDVVLADLRYYAIGDRLAMTIERSTESPGAFAADASNFRIKSRIDGRYLIQSSYTTGAGQNVSPVVVLSLQGGSECRIRDTGAPPVAIAVITIVPSSPAMSTSASSARRRVPAGLPIRNSASGSAEPRLSDAGVTPRYAVASELRTWSERRCADFSDTA